MIFGSRWIVAAAVLILGGCGGEPDGTRDGATGDWRIGLAGTDGRLGPATSHRDLTRMFGDRVVDTMIHMGEAQFAPGTVVHPDDPVRRIEVVWFDSARARPWRIQVAGDSTVWSIDPGVTLGTSLSELERLNARPFSLTGFGWDYGGTVMGWDQGRLEQALFGGDGRVILRLAVDSARTGSDAARAVTGDGVFPSSHPAMQRLDPNVRQIIVEYDAGAAGA